jgi:hypothetical protein
MLLTPTWLTGVDILMMSDLYRDHSTGQLLKFNNDNRKDKCEIYKESIVIDPEEELVNEDNRVHITIHRMIACDRFNALKEKPQQLVSDHKGQWCEVMNSRGTLT